MSKCINERSPVGRRLREARLRKGISQKELGILAGIDPFSASPRINQYEQDKHVPDFSTAKRLAEQLDISVTYLYAEDNQLADLIQNFSKLGANQKLRILHLMTIEHE